MTDKKQQLLSESQMPETDMDSVDFRIPGTIKGEKFHEIVLDDEEIKELEDRAMKGLEPVLNDFEAVGELLTGGKTPDSWVIEEKVEDYAARMEGVIGDLKVLHDRVDELTEEVKGEAEEDFAETPADETVDGVEEGKLNKENVLAESVTKVLDEKTDESKEQLKKHNKFNPSSLHKIINAALLGTGLLVGVIAGRAEKTIDKNLIEKTEKGNKIELTPEDKYKQIREKVVSEIEERLQPDKLVPTDLSGVSGGSSAEFILSIIKKIENTAHLDLTDKSLVAILSDDSNTISPETAYNVVKASIFEKLPVAADVLLEAHGSSGDIITLTGGSSAIKFVEPGSGKSFFVHDRGYAFDKDKDGNLIAKKADGEEYLVKHKFTGGKIKLVLKKKPQ